MEYENIRGEISITDSRKDAIIIYPPLYVNMLPVTSISDFAFAFGLIRTISFEEECQIRVIGNYAFARCAFLEKINAPASVESINQGAFYDCVSLKEVCFSRGSRLKTIGSQAFYGCISLKHINLEVTQLSSTDPSAFALTNIDKIIFPKTFEKLPENDIASLFGHTVVRAYKKILIRDTTGIIYSSSSPSILFCPKTLRATCLRNSIELIDSLAFNRCIITKVHFPASLLVIEMSAFMKCYELRSIAFARDSKLKVIKPYSFYKCDIRNVLLFPSSLVEIDHNAFEFNRHLKSIHFPNNSNIEIIDDYAFNITNIQFFDFPFSLRKIGNRAFQIDIKYHIDPNHPHFTSGPERSLISMNPLTLVSIEGFIIPNEIEVIGRHSFIGSMATTIVIPASVKVIEEDAFVGSHLNKIDFSPNSKLIEIKNNSFGSLILSTIVFPPSLRKIDINAFKGAIISNIVIENDVFLLENNTLYSKHPRGLINIQEMPSTYRIEQGTIEVHSSFFSRSHVEHVHVPYTVSNIGDKAFAYCKNLDTITFDMDIKLNIFPVSLFAFSGIKTITIPNSVEVISDSAFFSCINLKDIFFSDGSNIASISPTAFKGCLALKRIYLPKSIRIILIKSFINPNIEFVIK